MYTVSALTNSFEGYCSSQHPTAKGAISKWLTLNRKHPTMVAVVTNTRVEAVNLCDCFIKNFSTPNGYYNKMVQLGYSDRYIQYLHDECLKKIADGQMYFHESDCMPDQVHPFCYG